MPFYPDTATFYVVMTDLFGRMMAAPGVLKPLTDGKILLRMSVTGPDAVLTVDGRSNPPRFVTGLTDAKPDIGLRIPADVLHSIGLNRIHMRDAFMAGKMQLDTSPLRALSLMNSLTGIFRYTEQLYPQVLREHGMLL